MDLSWGELFTTEWEFVGFASGILSVFLLLFTRLPRLQYFNWIASIISASVYLFLFFSWALYGNAVLQVPFLILSFMGLWVWRGQLLGRESNVRELPTTYNGVQFVVVAFASLIGSFALAVILAALGDSAPVWDGMILALSLGAIYLQLRKYVQCWYLWIAVDLIAVPLHFSQGHESTAFLYLAYMAMCFVGLYTWHKEATGGDVWKTGDQETFTLSMDPDPQDQRSIYA